MAAGLLIPAGTLGFIRVFETPSAVTPAIAAGLVSALVASLLRHLRVPLLPAAAISFAALTAGLVARYAPDTARFLVIPTSETLSALRELLDDGLVQFREERAPVPASDPFVAAATIGAWILAFVTDWGAVRLRLAFEPVLPAGLLFVFSAVLGSGSFQIISTVVFAASVLLWTVTQRTARQSELTWLTVDRKRGPSGLARGGAVFGALALLGGVVVGPLIPGASAEELFYWRTQGDPTRVVVSPYVNIGSRLVDQKDTELFTVTSDRPSYYRLAGLDTFEDGFWRTNQQTFIEESGRLPGARSSAGTTLDVQQNFTIQNLSAIWLPAAYAPSAILESDAPFTWNSDTGSMIVASSLDSANGLSYSLESAIPLFSPDELRSASSVIPVGIAERYLSVPDDLTPVVASEAQRITSGAANTYEQMLALQAFFREFDYSVSLSPREGDATEQFLAERVGFCQQFSGTFALMARSLGVPARVAVGFTWGDPVDGQPNTYQITGRHTHAWPEVYFGDLGWVAFEPTPQRGSPAGTAYTGVEARQDSLTEPDRPGQPTTTVAPGDQTPLDINPNIEDFQPDLGAGLGGSDGVAGSGINVPWRILLVVAAITAYLLGIPALRRMRVAKRRAAAGGPADQVEAAWAEGAELLEHHYDIHRSPAETRWEFAQRLADDRRLPEGALTALAESATVARFGSDFVTADDANRAHEALDRLLDSVAQKRSRWQRTKTNLNPRTVIKPTQRTLVPDQRDRVSSNS